jgi:anti-sigma B factor antagonist
MTFSAEFELPVWRTARYTVAELPPEIDISNADDVGERLLDLATTGRPPGVPLIADMTRTTFCDSTGVSALLRLRRRLSPLGRRIYLVVPRTGLVRRVFDLAAVSHLVPICEDVGSAVAQAVSDTLDESGEPGTASTPV